MGYFSGQIADWELWTPSPVGPWPQVPAPIQSALLRRGISSESELHRYLHPDWSYLPDPRGLPDVEKALHLLHEAVQQRWPVYVVADYDVDGTTAAAIFGEFLTKVGCSKYFLHIPDRFVEGYGVSPSAVQAAIQGGYKLFVTVDCGTKEVQQLGRLKQAGLQVLVLDHHAIGPQEEWAPADAVVNPQRPDSTYPNRFLSAAALVLRVLQAYIQRYGYPEEWVEEWVELAALSLLADIMPVVGENRTLIQLGLARLAQTSRLGLRLLMERAGLPTERILRSREVLFQLIPRLNAPGRLHHARHTLFLLLCKGPEAKLSEVAHYMDDLNAHRQKLQEKALREALEDLERRYPGISNGSSPPPALVVANPSWNKGIVGLVAAKLSERFHRPAVALTSDASTGALTGSARSPAGIPLYALLEECKSYLVRFGGHDKAAGLTLRPDNLFPFTEALQASAALYVPLRPKGILDAIVSAEALSRFRLAEWVERFEPIGPANEAPRYLISGLRVVEHRDKRYVLCTPEGLCYTAWIEGDALTLPEALLGHSDRTFLVATPRSTSSGRVSLKVRDVIKQ